MIRVHLDVAAYTVGPFIIRSMKTSEILADAKSILDDTIQLRRRIHRHPEVGLQVPRTQAAVLEALDGSASISERESARRRS